MFIEFECPKMTVFQLNPYFIWLNVFFVNFKAKIISFEKKKKIQVSFRQQICNDRRSVMLFN